MLKTILSATVLALACLTLGGCSDDGVEGSVDDYGGERQNTESVSVPGVEEGTENFDKQDQGGGG